MDWHMAKTLLRVVSLIILPPVISQKSVIHKLLLCMLGYPFGKPNGSGSSGSKMFVSHILAQCVLIPLFSTLAYIQLGMCFLSESIA